MLVSGRVHDMKRLPLSATRLVEYSGASTPAFQNVMSQPVFLYSMDYSDSYKGW